MKVYSIGETVLDIIFRDEQPVAARAGGSVLNSSVSLGRLGVDVRFISDYGRDRAGDIIDNFLIENQVNTNHVVRFDSHKSAIALAFLDKKNNATYSFYKDFPERRLTGIKVDFTEDDYLLFGSFFAITDTVREGLLKILSDANHSGTTIIYDPNFRRPHLNELDKVRPYIIENISFADIVKGSDEDFELIFGEGTPERVYKRVMEAGCNNLIYTSGPNDVFVKAPGVDFQMDVPKVDVLSTIGAGDSFNAGIVWSLLNEEYRKKDLEHLPENAWRAVTQTGISFASEVCRHYENYISVEFVVDILKGSI